MARQQPLWTLSTVLIHQPETENPGVLSSHSILIMSYPSIALPRSKEDTTSRITIEFLSPHLLPASWVTLEKCLLFLGISSCIHKMRTLVLWFKGVPLYQAYFQRGGFVMAQYKGKDLERLASAPHPTMFSSEKYKKKKKIKYFYYKWNTQISKWRTFSWEWRFLIVHGYLCVYVRLYISVYI